MLKQAKDPSLGNVKLGKGSLTALLESQPPALCLRPAAGQAYMSVQYAADAEDAVLVWWWREQHRYPPQQQQPIFSEVNYSNVPAPPPRSHQHSLSALITTIAGSISPHMCKHCSSAHHHCCL